MNFNEQLNFYIQRLGCSGKELAEACGLSPTVISRYRTGERTPSPDSEQFQKLIAGLEQIAEQKGQPRHSIRQLEAVLKDSLNRRHLEYEIFYSHFTKLLDTLEVDMKALSVSTNYEISMLYRIRSGKRRPDNLVSFSEMISQYIVRVHDSESDLQKVVSLTHCRRSEVQDANRYFTLLMDWLLSEDEKTEHYMSSFLKKIDEFDLNEYIWAIHFDTLKVPSAMFQLPASRNYYGTADMRKGELDFFKNTVLSRSQESVFMYNELSMEYMAKDMEFNKKWMYVIAAALKKGLHLDIIHNLDRPFQELMLGFEAWIPIYMTGQIAPYYIPDNPVGIYQHMTYVSGAAALSGECIQGHHNNGKYYLTNNKEEMAYYRKQAQDLLGKARPLMEIYDIKSADAFTSFMKKNYHKPAERYHILTSPPLYTISEDLLKGILDANRLSRAERESILQLHQLRQRSFMDSLQEHFIKDQISMLSEEEFEKHPAILDVSETFIDKKIVYTYHQYRVHLEMTKDYSLRNRNYILEETPPAFRNISIRIAQGQYAVVSKNQAPVIQFVIRHPTMVQALTDFAIMVSE